MKHSCNQEETFTDGQRLRLLSYNIQVGSSVNTYRQYLTKSWEHILPSSERMENLSHIARMVSDYDLVGLQEVDAGSLRSGFINQTEYLADKARFPFWHHQTNRKIGRIAQHSNGFMSKFKPAEVYTHKLPGTIRGRGVLCARFGGKEESLIVMILHLALGKRSRMQQMSYISELEIVTLQKKANLCEPTHDLHTFPSWAPERNIDHILVSPSLKVESIHVLNHTFSDHLPIAMDVILPDTVRLAAS